MAKKTKDLFQLLQKRRAKGSFKITPEPEAREPVDLLGSLGDWFSGLFQGYRGGRRRPAKKRASYRAVGILVSGPTLVGLAFGSLVIGFLLGQGLGSDAPDDLRTTGTERLPPEWLNPATEPGVLAPNQQLQILGKHVYLLADYPIGRDARESQAKAERLATYLRARGLERTRIYRHWSDPAKDNGTWLTLYYTEGDGVEHAVLDQLSSLAPPAFEPRWQQLLARLSQYPAPSSLTPNEE